ncbi:MULTISPECIES: methyltransferase family protein [unclassified Bradyrhizobium]
MSTVTLTSKSPYERTMQLLGGMWFMLLALLVAIRVGSFADPWPSLLSSFCLASFYVLLGLLIITRPPAKAQADGLLPRMAAFVGTYMPWTIGFFGETDKALPNLASTVCVLTGMAMMLVTIRHLGRSFSLVPQARTVVQTGPYRWIKHPLYLAEEIVIFGVVLKSISPLTLGLFVLHIGVQVCRIHYEEDLLRRNCPEYASYEAARWRLIPYVW